MKGSINIGVFRKAAKKARSKAPECGALQTLRAVRELRRAGCCLLAATLSLLSFRAAAAQIADHGEAQTSPSAAHKTEAGSNAVAAGPITNVVSGEPPRSAEDLSLTNSLVTSVSGKNGAPAQAESDARLLAELSS